jgi:hypothetical protein
VRKCSLNGRPLTTGPDQRQRGDQPRMVEQAVVAEDDRRARPGDLAVDAVDREPAGFLVTHAPSRGVPLASQR